MSEPRAPILLFDGACRFCNRWVTFVLRHEATPRLRFAALQSEPARALLQARGIDPEVRDTMFLLEGDRLSSHSTALWRLGRYLQGWPRLLMLLRWIPVPVRDAGYRLFGRWRYRLFGADPHCSVLQPEVRQRFLLHDLCDD
ncbi:thiol-disulfide oxidoreductase DCC family protein [Algiphilus sp.]|uniref:thiol-disulfide oxidoreductase DCC family protein n=1 Tax=Algiphilus sp. TaxID=1872431 RepID=UPI003B517922